MMKKIYSIILLFAFMVGVLQPILPMIEYQLHQGDIFELLDHIQNDKEKPNTYVVITAADQAPTHSSDHDQTLLNDNFYPLGIAVLTVPRMIVFALVNRLYLPPTQNVASIAFLPNPPPPRLS